jgi:hypothetical protein
MTATRFKKYPENPLHGIDWKAADGPAYLREQLNLMAQKLTQCRAELQDVEEEALQSRWDRGRTQRKNERLQSYTHHVVNTIGIPIERSRHVNEHKLKKREEILASREKLFKLDRVLMKRERDDFEKAIQRMAAEAKETIDNTKRLREKVFTNDAKLNKLRQD